MATQKSPQPQALAAGYISEENGQGMGIPARCALWRLGHVCKGEIRHSGRFYECQNCRASYGGN